MSDNKKWISQITSLILKPQKHDEQQLMTFYFPMVQPSNTYVKTTYASYIASTSAEVMRSIFVRLGNII